jgi:hypothetical protein
MLTKQDLQNILTLIGMADIKGKDAVSVAVLVQKINDELKAPEETKQ